MRISRLRWRLAIRFALTSLAVIVAANAGLFYYLRDAADRQFRSTTIEIAKGLRDVIVQEKVEGGTVGHGAARSTLHEILAEWSAPVDAILARIDSTSVTQGSPALVEELTAGFANTLPQISYRDGNGFRMARAMNDEGSVEVIVGRLSTALLEHQETVATWLFVAIPVVLLCSAVVGYALAAQVLRPLDMLTLAIADIRPEDLDRRLPVGPPHDEIQRLGNQFNHLLDRLSAARKGTSRFVAQAAHQLKTPLTIIQGESSLALERPREADEYRVALGRIHTAAHQMSHRVDQLLMLALDESHERPAVSDAVELDGLVLACADLMRGRATEAERLLELGAVATETVCGNEVLLHEVILELIDNAIRHGQAGESIRIGAAAEQGIARLTVSSRGEPIPDPTGEAGIPDGGGLGIPTLRWIAAVHHGTLTWHHVKGRNVVVFEWPGGKARIDTG